MLDVYNNDENVARSHKNIKNYQPRHGKILANESLKVTRKNWSSAGNQAEVIKQENPCLWPLKHNGKIPLYHQACTSYWLERHWWALCWQALLFMGGQGQQTKIK